MSTDVNQAITEARTAAKPPRSSLSRRDFLRLTAITGSSAAFLAACATAGIPVAAPAADAGTEAAPGSAEAAATKGGTMIWMGHQEVAGLSPNDVGATVQWYMIANIHNAMIQITPTFELSPVLATSWETAEDSLTHTFQLTEGVKFSDGTDFTSADVKYTFEFYADAEKGSTLASAFTGMGEIETPDPLTVVIHMNEINADFLANAATTWIVQSAYHAEVGEDVYRTAPIGTGQFVLEEWVPAEYTLLKANENHFRGRPNLDFIRMNIVPEPSVRAIALETGEAHVSNWPLLVEDSLRLRDEGYLYYATPAQSVKHFPLNNELPLFADKNVRKAILMATDRQRIIDELWSGTAVMANSYYTPAGVTYFKPDVAVTPYDPEGAKALLEEAGWVAGADGIREKDGVKATYTCTTITGDQARRPIAEMVQQFLLEIGVDMQLEEAPVATILDGLRAGTMDSSIFNWTYGDALIPDPSNTLRSDGGNNFSHWKNDRADELMDIGISTTDVAERQAAYAELQDLVAEEVPFIFLQFDQWIQIYVPGVTGLPAADSITAGDNIFSEYSMMMGIPPQNG